MGFPFIVKMFFHEKLCAELLEKLTLLLEVGEPMPMDLQMEEAAQAWSRMDSGLRVDFLRCWEPLGVQESSATTAPPDSLPFRLPPPHQVAVTAEGAVRSGLSFRELGKSEHFYQAFYESFDMRMSAAFDMSEIERNLKESYQRRRNALLDVELVRFLEAYCTGDPGCLSMVQRLEVIDCAPESGGTCQLNVSDCTTAQLSRFFPHLLS